MCGIAFEAEFQSKINQSQSIFDVDQVALFLMSTSHLYVLIQPHLDTDLLIMFDEVFFQICITFAQVS
jgi:hypothetical protein